MEKRKEEYGVASLAACVIYQKFFTTALSIEDGKRGGGSDIVEKFIRCRVNASPEFLWIRIGLISELVEWKIEQESSSLFPLREFRS